MKTFETSFLAYDTLCRIQVNMADAHEAAAILKQGEEIALEVQSVLNRFDDQSELSKVCASYQTGVPCFISPLFTDFLDKNLHIAALTAGAHDPTIGAVMSLWDFSGESVQAPEETRLQKALAHVGYQHMEVNRKKSTVTFNKPGMQLDPGASGKGFALEQVVNYLRAQGVGEAVLDFGGNLYVIGAKSTPQGKRPWKVAIKSPDRKESVIGSVCLENGGIATSSWYEHYFEKDGKVYHHLLDPKTGKPKPLTVKSVSILSSSAMYTDLLSTGFFILGVAQGGELLKKLRAQSKETIEYVAVLANGEIASSQGAGFSPEEMPVIV